MISVDEALARVLALARPVGTERVSLRHAAGRVLAEAATATRDQPPFPASAMDGYAIRQADHHAGRILTVIGTARAGEGFAGAVAEGQAVRIFTGAPVPQGADRVVIQEDVTAAGTTIVLGDRLEAGTNIRPAGQDFRAGQTVLPGRRLGAHDLALLASMNAAEVTVARRPVVAIIATGDELVMPGDTPGPDQIIASNSFALAAMAEAAGAEARLLPIARDTAESLRFVLSLAEGADLIVTIGGASVGDHDLVGAVAAELGLDRSFYKVAMRPGKPLMAGQLGDSALLGLPGNPVSSIVCGHIFMLPLIAALLGLPAEGPATGSAVLGSDIGPTGPRTHYMRARLERPDGALTIRPFDNQDSAMLRLLTEADALLIRPAGDGPRPAGSEVRYISLR